MSDIDDLELTPSAPLASHHETIRRSRPTAVLAVGAAALVGQALGAGRPDRARDAAWLCVGAGSAFALLWSLPMLLAPQRLALAFTGDEEVVAIASTYLVVIGWSQVLMTVEIVLDGAFSGAADTMPPLVVGVPLALARIPLAWLLAHPLGLGVEGIWWALSVTSMAKGLLLAWWFQRGRWTRGHVRSFA